MFTDYPTYDRYRTLGYFGPSEPVQSGEDVYALQTALVACGFNPGTADGVLGVNTSNAIKAAQKSFKLVQDGLAGGKTQERLCSVLCVRSHNKFNIADGLLYGQVGHESGFRVGNYSPLYGDKSFDAGATQRNTNYTSAKDGFTVGPSIDALAKRLRDYYDKFEGIRDEHRRWELACGSWNAPAWACYIAKEEGATQVRASETAQPTPEQRVRIETYIDSCTAYLRV